MDKSAFVPSVRSSSFHSSRSPSSSTHYPRRRRRPPTAMHALQKHDLFHTIQPPRTENPVHETAIFIHDFLTDSRLFIPLTNTLQLYPYTLITYDMRGFGRSPDPHAPYSRSEDIHFLHSQPVHLVGSGLGGVVALEYALSHPESVSSVAVIGSGLPGHRWSEESFLDITKARTVGRFLSAGAYLSGRDRDLVQWKQTFISSNKTWDVLKTGDHEVAKALIEMARLYRGFHFFEADPLVPPPLETPPLRDRLDGVQVPVLVMVGDGDTLDFREIAQEIRGGVRSDKNVVIVEDAGHFAVMERPTVVATELMSFWESLREKVE